MEIDARDAPAQRCRYSVTERIVSWVTTSSQISMFAPTGLDQAASEEIEQGNGHAFGSGGYPWEYLEENDRRNVSARIGAIRANPRRIMPARHHRSRRYGMDL